jgi:hypothetical protein
VVIRNRQSKKDRQCNGLKKNDTRTNNDIQNTKQKTRDRATVVSFISSSTVKMWSTTTIFVGKYQHFVEKYCQLHIEDDERWYFGNQNLVQNWLLLHYYMYVLRWPCILFNMYIMVEAIASLSKKLCYIYDTLYVTKIKCIMHTMLFVMLYVRVGILLACVKLLYDRIISLRGEIFDRKTNLTWPIFNKVTVSTKESERLYISVLGVYIWPLFTIF